MKLSSFLILLCLFNQVIAQVNTGNVPSISSNYDLIITNGRILDGTGNSWYRADIGIRGKRIAFIGHISTPQSAAARVIDAKGQVVSPGFIDVHTHIEEDEARNPTTDNFIHDGVTTVITGNCGSSKLDLGNYFRYLDSLKLSINVASLIGHNDVRKSVMGTANRPPSPAEMEKMESLVEKAMKDGAAGLSTGLIYVPGTYSTTPEITGLARVAAKYNGVYATHMRSESDSVLEAIGEALEIGKEASIPVEISHFKVGGQRKPGMSIRTLQLVEEARARGIDVTIDQYPYTASSTSLNSLLPAWVLEGDKTTIRSRLEEETTRKAVIAEMLIRLKRRGRKHYDYAVVTNYPFDTGFNGRSIEQINRLMGKRHSRKQEARTILSMVINGGAQMVFHGMWEEDVRRIMQYPFNITGSDASIRIFGEGVPHPRGYGSNARVLAKYVREEKLISLEEAVRRMTSLPARKFHLKDRGLLLEGYYADLIIFDENNIRDESTYTNPHAYSKGVSYVIVNGQLVVEEGKHLGTRSGETLRVNSD